jgi:putative Holliday junction resolvase
MKYLGIDYGTKKIGLALSDDRGMIASPKTILRNEQGIVQTIAELCQKEGIEEIVVGESVQLDGTHNALMNDIETFIAKLENQTSLPIHLEKEWMSSVAARGHLYGKGNIANERWTGKGNQKKREAIDDNAAAVILQRYLDKQR